MDLCHVNLTPIRTVAAGPESRYSSSRPRTIYGRSRVEDVRFRLADDVAPLAGYKIDDLTGRHRAAVLYNCGPQFTEQMLQRSYRSTGPLSGHLVGRCSLLPPRRHTFSWRDCRPIRGEEKKSTSAIGSAIKG